jgi:hypothetical protein
MKSSSRINQVLVIRILTSDALASLREVLGVGVGIGLGKSRPTKAQPIVYCCLNDILTSVELPDEIPDQFSQNPKHRLDCNGIDFIYTVDSQFLQCNVRYTKLTVTTEAIAVNRIAIATIHVQQIIPYVGAMFLFGDTDFLCSIDGIQEGIALCTYVEEDLPPFHLTLQEVSTLIATFGRRR